MLLQNCILWGSQALSFEWFPLWATHFYFNLNGSVSMFATFPSVLEEVGQKWMPEWTGISKGFVCRCGFFLNHENECPEFHVAVLNFCSLSFYISCLARFLPPKVITRQDVLGSWWLTVSAKKMTIKSLFKKDNLTFCNVWLSSPLSQ